MIQIMPEQSVRKLDLGAPTVSADPNGQSPDHSLKCRFGRIMRRASLRTDLFFPLLFKFFIPVFMFILLLNCITNPF